jgi:hypothetical protein
MQCSVRLNSGYSWLCRTVDFYKRGQARQRPGRRLDRGRAEGQAEARQRPPDPMQRPGKGQAKAKQGPDKGQARSRQGPGKGQLGPGRGQAETRQRPGRVLQSPCRGQAMQKGRAGPTSGQARLPDT